jgi:dephospho-CoA kinase
MRKIGVTGGIATGKSMVGELLTGLDIPVIDADAVVHSLLREDTALLADIRRVFGDTVFETDTGALNRSALGQIVFADPEKRRQLEGWIHPKVRERLAAFMAEQAERGHCAAAALIPLLYESGLEAGYDEVWTIWATEAQQLARLQQHRGMSAEAAQARIASQLPIEDKVRRANVVIDNRGDRAATRQQVLVQVERLRRQSARPQ